MASANVEIVRQFFEARNRGGVSYLAFVAPDAEFDLLASRGPYRGTYRGPAEYTLKDGKIVRFRLFQTRAKALEAVELRE